MDNAVLNAIRYIFSAPVPQETKELVAREYRQLRGVMRRSPDYAEIDRQIEEIFEANGVPAPTESESPKS